MKRNEYFNGFTLFVALACLLNLVMNLINHRFHPGDFQVYYSAAEQLVSGDPVYMVSFYTGSGYYKYSPVILLFFLPYLPFPLFTASVLHFLVQSVAFYLTFRVIRRILQDFFSYPAGGRGNLLLTLSFAGILIHLTRELYVGNINILLLLLTLLSLQMFLEGRERPGGILAGIALLAKPYLAILLLPMVMRGRWKATGWAAATVLAGLLLPFLYPGPVRAAELYSGWYRTLTMHAGGFPGMTSVDYLAARYIAGWPSYGNLLIFLLLMALAVVFIRGNIRIERTDVNPDRANANAAFEWFLLAALIPNLIKTDWVLLLFSAPLIAFMVFTVAARKSYGWIPVLVVLLFFYGANSDDLLGRELSRKILHSGLMGLANFLLVIVAAVMYRTVRIRS